MSVSSKNLLTCFKRPLGCARNTIKIKTIVVVWSFIFLVSASSITLSHNSSTLGVNNVQRPIKNCRSDQPRQDQRDLSDILDISNRDDDMYYMMTMPENL